MVDAAGFLSWPAGAFGLSSGWHQGPVSRRPMSVRQPVCLKPIDASVEVVGSDDAGPPLPMLIKTPARDAPGAVPGLSSGAASALVRQHGRVYKIKRCGFRNGEPFRDEYAMYSVRTDEIETRESSRLEVRLLGWMSAQCAQNEVAGLAAFAAAGLPVAYKPVSIHSWSDPCEPEDPRSALISEIISDLRADEFFFAILAPRLAQNAMDGQLHFKPESGRMDFRGAKIDGAFIDIEMGQTGHRLEALGLALGGALRRVHDAGLLRGHRNVWFGNDVISPDGWICPVDCDGIMPLAEFLPSEKIRRLHRLERAEYSALLFAELIHFQSVVIAEAGRRLREAVDHGYEACAEPKMPPQLVQAVLADFAAARAILYTDDTLLSHGHDTARKTRSA